MKEVRTIKTWELKQSTDPNTLEMYVYGNIEAGYYDFWSDKDVMSETSAEFFREELAKYPDVENINLYVNSFGGYVFEAMAIRNQLKRHKATVTGFVDGFAASAASFILTGCDVVKMYSNTTQMLHNMMDIAIGNSKELRKAADDMDVITEGNRQAYLEKSNGKITEEQLIEILDNETWLTAKECFNYGLCDEVIEKEIDLTNAKQIMQQMNKSLEQHISYNKALTNQLKELSKPIEKKEPEEVIEPKQKTNAEKIRLAFSKKMEE